MNRSRILVYATAGIILGATVLSGPAVGVVDLTTPRYDTSSLGEGNATVDRVDAPSTVALERGYQSQTYYLTVPDARIHIESLSGKPTVAYGVEIPEFGYSRSTTHFLNSGSSGWVPVTIREDTFRDSQIDASEYDGRLTVVLRDSSGRTLLHNESVTVAVTG